MDLESVGTIHVFRFIIKQEVKAPGVWMGIHLKKYMRE